MQKNRFDLTGRVALVTGASSGFGAHFCKILAQAGAHVIACARRLDKLEALVAEIRANDGVAYAVAMDVTDVDSVTNAFTRIDSLCSTVDVLVNNAGVGEAHRFIDTSEANWDHVIDTNLKAVWRVARHCVERMRANGGGSIINIASILGLQPGFGFTLYATSKAGVIQLTKNMALELQRDKIRVNALCPGYFKTEMNEAFFSTPKGLEFIKNTPAERWGELEELSGPLLLLASDSGSFINGVALPVDGGHLLGTL